MIWFGKSVIRFCKSFIKYDKACWYTDVQLGQDQTKDAYLAHAHTGLLDLGLEAGRAVGCWHGVHTLVCYHW